MRVMKIRSSQTRTLGQPASLIAQDRAVASAAPQATVAIHTHGCKLNQADSELLAQRFVEEGYRVVPWENAADVYILNTCTVTATADSKARQTLRSTRRKNDRALIVATGCYAQQAGTKLSGLIPDMLVVGNTQKDSLVSAVSDALASKQEYRTIEAFGASGASGNAAAVPAAATPEAAVGRTRANIKIQEGCNQVCAYCIVPRVRGRERSIPPEVVLREINRREERGCQEIVLTGTQLGSYGFDIPGTSLLKLLQQILSESTVPRIRVSSLQPQEITTELLELWQDQRLCPHFHLPLQSGNNRILAAMRRRYDTATFTDTVENIRRIFPNAGITADLIVGFPGENRDEFRESREFARSMQFSDMHIFPYSARPGTSAAYFGDQLPQGEKKERTAEMVRVAAEGFEAFRQQQLGQTRQVLWESTHPTGSDSVWSGLTDNYIRVSAEDERDLANTITTARLVRLSGSCVTTRTL